METNETAETTATNTTTIKTEEVVRAFVAKAVADFQAKAEAATAEAVARFEARVTRAAQAASAREFQHAFTSPRARPRRNAADRQVLAQSIVDAVKAGSVSAEEIRVSSGLPRDSVAIGIRTALENKLLTKTGNKRGTRYAVVVAAETVAA